MPSNINTNAQSHTLRKKRNKKVPASLKKGSGGLRISWKKSIDKYWQLYLLLLPVVASFIIFQYLPMTGIQIAFKDFTLRDGIWGSEWIGFYHFKRFFTGFKIKQIISNTVLLSVQHLVFTFPFPIIFALALNEIKKARVKSVVQTITFAPHFISTVVVVGMMTTMILPSTGIINVLLMRFGIIEEGIYFSRLPQYFRSLYITSSLWTNMGWSSIIYISSIAAIDPQLYEAAEIDGAGKFRQMIHITLAGIVPVIVTMLILNFGNIMSVGFEKVFLMQTSTNLVNSEVISTYVYDRGISGGQYDFATAVGLFESIINLIMIVLVNKIARKYSEVSLW